MLILAAIPFYLLAVATTLEAARRGDRLTWVALAVLFAAMIAVRAGDLENIVRDALRGMIAARDSYGERRIYQGVVAGLCVAAALGAVWLATRGGAKRREGTWIWLAAGRLAGIGFVTLAALRMVSLHQIDALLYGPLHANRILDPGFALVVAASAWRYRSMAKRRSSARS